MNDTDSLFGTIRRALLSGRLSREFWTIGAAAIMVSMWFWAPHALAGQAAALTKFEPLVAEWTKDLVIYESRPEASLRKWSRSGTFESLRERLPYLQNLGVTGIWLAGYALSDSNPLLQYLDVLREHRTGQDSIHRWNAGRLQSAD